jgi:hypothetical protein
MIDKHKFSRTKSRIKGCEKPNMSIIGSIKILESDEEAWKEYQEWKERTRKEIMEAFAIPESLLGKDTRTCESERTKHKKI